MCKNWSCKNIPLECVEFFQNSFLFESCTFMLMFCLSAQNRAQ